MEEDMNLDSQEAKQLALDVAKLSPCSKRKVGAVITDQFGEILCHGFNHNGDIPCEDAEGKTSKFTMHAEIAAIGYLPIPSKPAIIYVTHEPCKNCAEAINKAGIIHTVIVEEFMKFDSGKLRYGLIPPSATKSLAEVLTYGAKKYKPNNWQRVDDTSRYVDALYRHLEAWRNGEKLDSESKLSHLAHALTNIAFLIHFEDK
jgi:deoxycytidylate deaminase